MRSRHHGRGPHGDVDGSEERHRRLAAQKGDALLVVDMVTSLAGIEVAVDAWGVRRGLQRHAKNASVSRPGSPRSACRMRRGPPCLSAQAAGISISTSVALRRRRERRWTGYHHTAPVTMIYALHAGLGSSSTRVSTRGLAPLRMRAHAPRWARGVGTLIACSHAAPAAPAHHGQGARHLAPRLGRLTCDDSCSSATGSRSGLGRGNWPGKSGVLGAWATPPDDATW